MHHHLHVGGPGGRVSERDPDPVVKYNFLPGFFTRVLFLVKYDLIPEYPPCIFRPFAKRILQAYWA